MFWACFSYDKKGPCHIWKKKTVAEKRECELDLAKINAALKSKCKARWELKTGMRRMGLKILDEKKPKWTFTVAIGKIIITGKKGGITWYRYQKKVLIPKLLPFAQRCKLERPNTEVIKDKTPAYAFKYQEPIFMFMNILRMPWPGNSLDLNVIELCWSWMKRRTTMKDALRTRKETKKTWIKCWKDLSQARIQSWIKRMPRHIAEVIRLKDGNEYRENSEGGDIRPYDPTKRANSYIRSYMKHHSWNNKGIPRNAKNAKNAKGFSACCRTLRVNLRTCVMASSPAFPWQPITVAALGSVA